MRAQEGGISEIDENTIAYHFHEPLGVVGQIIPWNFPILMAIWKLAPALAAGNAVVLKPAEQTPASIHVLNELVADLLPPGVLNIVNGFGVEAGKPLASNKRIRKIAFTGETTTGRLIMQYASENLIPVTLELGGKSPNIFFDDVAAKQDAFYDKALEGFAMFALNQGEVCTCPSRALIQGGDVRRLPGAGGQARGADQAGPPARHRHDDRRAGVQRPVREDPVLHRHRPAGGREGPRRRRAQADLGGELAGGYYIQPTIFEGDNSMRIFQEEIFGPVVSVARFADYDDAMKIANDTLYGLGAGVWSRDVNTAYRAGRDIQAGRVWVNNYHAYPAHAAFGGYKQSGIGSREPQDDARPLPADQEHAGQLLAERARLLLMTERVALTPAAEELLVRLTAIHGPLMFHQSGGCCDGSAPMCYPDGDFKVGGSDVHLGDLAVPGLEEPIGFYMSGSQYEYWKHTHLTVDVVKGRGSGFSVEAPEGVRFLIRSRLL